MADAGRKMRDCKRTQNPPKEIVNEIKTAFIRSGSESEAIAAHPPENSRSPCAAARKTSSFMPMPENKTAAEVASACLQDGLMVLTAHEKVRLLPPLNISYEDLAAGLAILKKHFA